ncbi:sortase-associated OmpA-like protein PdsO [Pseudoalteromonas sp. G4]|uniref:sortase-associated OmpA-like protein PdsO n=1 Tax=Pseudoalteromonas sp. G4 TaxID=2992761 RepID=UPI00237E6DEA|nr:sortase-associated OmpA-like protein PdsO [Pseudoalteromonas sp. G4]MDE3272194.1 sortase-associated OmpA-like protein PdsO [Pseudoalteromonas sp. G4]
MKKALLVSVIALALSNPAMATEKEFEKEPLIGFGAGATVGAIVGGPVGALAGGIVGIFIGKIEGDKVDIKEQQAEISKQQQTIVALQHKTSDYQELVASKQQLESQLERIAQQRIDNLLAMSVQFRSGSADIEPHFAEQLIELAEVMKQQPEIYLDLNGFADQRGDDENNLALSTKRADNVAAFLIKQGVDHNRLSTHGFGESQSIAKQNAEDSFESNVFDRRVTVHARMQEQSQTANNQY